MSRISTFLFAAALLLASARPAAAASCVPSSTDLCLLDGRFTARLSWNDGSGEKHAFVAAPRTDGADSASGLFFYYAEDASNWEILVKMIDGCRTNDHFWVLVAGSTGFGWTLEVTDEATGVVRSFTHPLDGQASGLEDFEAFATCAAATPTPSPVPTPTRTPGPTPSGGFTPTPSPTPPPTPTPTPRVEPTPNQYSAVVRYSNQVKEKCGLYWNGYWDSLITASGYSWFSEDGATTPYQSVYTRTLGPFSVTTSGQPLDICPPSTVVYPNTFGFEFGKKYTIIQRTDWIEYPYIFDNYLTVRLDG